MAKSTKGKRKQKQQDFSRKKRKVDSSSFGSENKKLVPRNKTSPTSFPSQFPHEENLITPQNDFLQDVEPYKESFRRAVDTAYEGFVVDKDISLESSSSSASSETDGSPLFDHEDIQHALMKMEEHGLFRTDVTQPFGLGTKCAKTYVTRCLLGEEGTTYKYLGLRMFSHPWHAFKSMAKRGDSMGLADALGIIGKLNNRLTDRTKLHLGNLEEKRRERMGGHGDQSYIHGRAKYDVALINRMVNTPDLKFEPTIGKKKCSVSWHADSSLEHYSSIAVYQTVVTEQNAKTTSDGKKERLSEEERIRQENELASKWSIALRVAHDSEGPAASRRGTNIESAVVSDTPAISVSLPSRSAYYLLDDFNHHHQHAVLVNDNNSSHSAGVRFASTHRLLRDSHNVNYVLERCRSACSQFHRKGPKIWRSEQLLLSDIESEWIRQFYIQGQGHKENLWKYWQKPMCQLLKYWSLLEGRTKQVIDLLSFAAMARCNQGHEKKQSGEVPSRAERKRRDKQKKALASVEDLVKRGSDGAANGNVIQVLYDPICVLLEERAKMRSLWMERQSDGLFHAMPDSYKPIPVPFQFGILGGKVADENASSPLGGSPDELRSLGNDLRQYGEAYVSCRHSDLPKVAVPRPITDACQMQSEEATKSTTMTKSAEGNEDLKEEKSREPHLKKTEEKQEICKKERKSENKDMQKHDEKTHSIQRPVVPIEDHRKDIKWKGWNSIRIGLEMQEPWARLLMNGTKTIETRAYDIPKALIGKKIEILQSKSGKDGVSSLSNILTGKEINESVERIGWCTFEKVVIYRYKAKFEGDEKKHLVKAESNYGWKDDTKVVYGWVVGKRGKYNKNQKKVRRLVRRMRSLFELQS